MSNTNPDYYKTGGIEPIDFIKAQKLDFDLGNVVKYVCRAGRKTEDPTEDLRKAMYYLQHELDAIKKESDIFFRIAEGMDLEKTTEKAFGISKG